MGWLSAIGKFLFGGGASPTGASSIVQSALNVASEKVLDVDKLVALLADVIKQQQQLDASPAWVTMISQITKDTPFGVRAGVIVYIWGDVIHKLARTLLWLGVIAAYVYVSKSTGKPMDLDHLLAISAGPGVYTLLKGSGRFK